jgi:hypothetical protein
LPALKYYFYPWFLGRYLAAVSELIKWASELDPGLPWLVNTMGWCKGLGLLLMKGTVPGIIAQKDLTFVGKVKFCGFV